MKTSGNSATMKISRDLKSITEDPVEGVFCELIDESNIFEWKIWFEGPGDSPFQGGIFEAVMTFPQDYPMSPPSLRVVSEFWHPNVYRDGRVCISILHTPGNDPMSGELPEERWLPTQTVSTIMLSFQSMLSDPNISSPANIDASVQWRDHRNEFLEKAQFLSEKAKKKVPPHVKIPHPDTDPEERKRRLDKMQKLSELSTFSLHDDVDVDSFEVGSEEEGESGASEVDDISEEDNQTTEASCPVCQVKMTKQKSNLKCQNCPILLSSGGKFMCGRKCYILDCGEILPTGTCDYEIQSSNGWKCPKKIHKDDPNGEDNFLETL